MFLRDQIAIVTGGAKGIGRAVSIALAKEGADLMLVARDAAALSEVAREVASLGRTVEVATADVGDAQAMENVAKQFRRSFGERADILVNTSGVPGPIETPLQNVDVDAFEHVMRVNVTGTFLAMKYFVPIMIENRRGRIINIGSNSGRGGYPNRIGYAASKWAVRGMTRTAAVELGKYGITVNCINPGIVDGARMQTLCSERARVRGVSEDVIRREYVSSQAIAQVTSEADVAAVVVYLASEAATNITGQDINIDGGWRL